MCQQQPQLNHITATRSSSIETNRCYLHRFHQRLHFIIFEFGIVSREQPSARLVLNHSKKSLAVLYCCCVQVAVSQQPDRPTAQDHENQGHVSRERRYRGGGCRRAVPHGCSHRSASAAMIYDDGIIVQRQAYGLCSSCVLNKQQYGY